MRKISTHSAREDGDNEEFFADKNAMDISTHSAREDGDKSVPYQGKFGKDFNPLRPRGRRPNAVFFCVLISDISTHSAREDGDSPLLAVRYS